MKQEQNQGPEPAQSACNGLLAALATEWEKEGAYLDNPWDDALDRQAGRVYKNCARELREALSR